MTLSGKPGTPIRPWTNWTRSKTRPTKTCAPKKAAYAPEIYLFGMRELHEDDLTVLEPAWAVGAGLSFTLFDGLARPNRIHAAQKLEEQAGLMRQKLARDLETLVSAKYQELMKAGEQFDALQTAMNFCRRKPARPPPGL